MSDLYLLAILQEPGEPRQRGDRVSLRARRSFASIVLVMLLTALLTPHAALTSAAEPDATVVSGVISEDTTWSGNILVRVPGVSVAQGVTLKIEPGTTVKFEKHQRYLPADLDVYGTLIAVGTPDKPIRFTSAASQPQHWDWMGIRFRPGSAGSIIDHSMIEYGAAGVYVEDNVTLSNSIVRWTKGCALPLYSTCTITRNRVYECGHNCIEVHYRAQPIIAYNTLWGCTSGAGIMVQDHSHPTIRHNIITANKGPGIVVGWNSSAIIEFNTITGNNYDGIHLGQVVSISQTIIRHNNIYGNKGPHGPVENVELVMITERGNVTVTDNWWGTDDKEAIEAGLYHNPPTSTLIYEPYLTSEVDIGEVAYDFENNETYTNLPMTEYDTYQYVFTEDDESRKVVDSIKPPGGLAGIAWDGENLWVADGDTIYKCDASGNVTDFFRNPATCSMGLAFDGQYLWVLDYSEQLVYQLNRSGSVIKSIRAPYAEPQGLTYDGKYLWAFTNQIRGRAFRFDTSGNVVEMLDTGAGFSGLAWDGEYLWINAGAYVLYQIDPYTGHEIRAITASGVDTQYLCWQDPYLLCCEWADEITEHGRIVKLLPRKERITMDGLRDDWWNVSSVLVDPEGDAVRDRMDVKAVYGFTDDRYLYLMLEFYELAEYQHLDISIDFNGDGHPEYDVYGFEPHKPGLHLALRDCIRGETKSGMFEIGYYEQEVGCNAKEVLELKAPLWFFENRTEFCVRSSLAGHADGERYTIDETGWAVIRSVYAPTAATLNDPTDITDNSAKLGWTMNNDRDFAAYEIYQSTSYGTLGTKIAELAERSATSHNVIGLSPGTTYYFTIRVVDTSGLSTDSNQVSGRTLKVSTAITCSVSPSEITEDDFITISGATTLALSDRIVTLTYKKPDGSTLNRTVTTGSDGSYSDSYRPDATGSWSVTASWSGDSIRSGASSLSRSFTVKERPFTGPPLETVTISGGIVAAIMIVTLVVFKRRKS